VSTKVLPVSAPRGAACLLDEAQPVGAQLGERLAIVRSARYCSTDRPRPADAGHLGDLVLGGALQFVERREVLDQKLGVDPADVLMPSANSTRAKGCALDASIEASKISAKRLGTTMSSPSGPFALRVNNGTSASRLRPRS